MSKASIPTLSGLYAFGLIQKTLKEKQQLIEDCLCWCSQNCEGEFRVVEDVPSELKELESEELEGLAEAIALPTVVFELDSDAVKFKLAHDNAPIRVVVGGKP